ncbi:DUF4158 domain-containing protein [Streptosporangium canum]|uniref:DUF4158 domain-containing protein n=2 Tax=Streptosporangium canum TaxID=324952 RepID=UPI0033A37754
MWRADDHCRYVRSGFIRYGTWSGALSEKMFSDEQLEQLRSFPEISADELIRYFTPTAADAAFVSPGGRGPVDRLGMLVQLCTLPGREST